MADQKKVILKKTGVKKDIIKIQFFESLNKRLQHTYLAASIGKCFKNNFYKIILDMTNINEPSYPFIATIIEATAKARTKSGDVKIINISDEAKHVLLSFNIYTYLTKG